MSGELIARGGGGGGKSLSFVCVCATRSCLCVRVRECLCSCARTGDGTGDKRIGHARGILRSPYPSSCVGQKPRPGVCCHWLIRHDTYSSIFTMSLVLLLREEYVYAPSAALPSSASAVGTIIINSYTYIGTRMSVCVCAQV